MWLTTFLTLFGLVSMKSLPKETNTTYWSQRSVLMDEDLSRMLGSDLTLNADEQAVNNLLIGYRDTEFANAFLTLEFPPSKSFFNSSDLTLNADEQAVNNLLIGYRDTEFANAFLTLEFPPSKSFFNSKAQIEQSDIFKLIQKMPKGAILHSHDMALTSLDWVVGNLTYWPDLYMCNLTDGLVIFRYFSTPDTTCDWKLVSDVRASYPTAEEFDKYLHELFSLETPIPEIKYPNINSVWAAFQNLFGSLAGITSNREAWEAYLAEALKEIMDDNVSYLEFRGVLDSLYDKDGRIYNPEETVAIYQAVVDTFTAENPRFYGSRFIYAPSRLVDETVVEGYVSLAISLVELYPSFVAGFDLVGQEDKGRPLKEFINPLLVLGEQVPPIPVFYHAGETDWKGLSTDENIFDALLLNSTRIGHGYAIAKHPSLIQKAIEMDVAVEICPISNQVLMLVEDLRNHPGAFLATTAVPMVISSDDPALWGALPLSHDMYEAFVGIGGAKADLKFLKKLALNSIRYSSLDDTRKAELEALWLSQWNEFIASNLPVSVTDSENNLNSCNNSLLVEINVEDNLINTQK